MHLNRPDLNSTLKAEIDAVLQTTGLMQILARYGEPLIVGSYAYDLMVWKDFDINLTFRDFSQDSISALVNDLGKALHPERLVIHNHIIQPQAERPNGIWIGIFLNSGWKIDLWLLNKQEAAKKKREFEQLCALLATADKDAIKNIKAQVAQHPDYHRAFSSVDIYHAVALDGVSNIENFQDWLSKNKGLDYDFGEITN